MVRKHNVLTAIAFVLGVGTSAFIGVTHYRHKVRQRKYNALVQKEAARLKLCPDKGRIKQYGNCLEYDQRIKMREEADKLAEKKDYLRAAMNYIRIGDWVSARTMAGRANEKDRATIKRELKIRQDAREKVCNELKLDCKKIE